MAAFNISLNGQISVFDNTKQVTNLVKTLALSLGVGSVVSQGNILISDAPVTLPILGFEAFFLYIRNLSTTEPIIIDATINNAPNAIEYIILPGGLLLIQNTSIPSGGETDVDTGITAVSLESFDVGATALVEYIIAG